MEFFKRNGAHALVLSGAHWHYPIIPTAGGIPGGDSATKSGFTQRGKNQLMRCQLKDDVKGERSSEYRLGHGNVWLTLALGSTDCDSTAHGTPVRWKNRYF